jgi:hypothetical protein
VKKPSVEKEKDKGGNALGNKVVKSVLTTITYSIGSAVADALLGSGRKGGAGRKVAKSAVRSATTSILRGALGGMKR